MAKSLSIVCFVLAVESVAAHLCVLSPQQRGGLADVNLNQKGSGGCILMNGPCGQKQEEAPQINWKSGSNVTVVFQKNLDHWNKVKPGYFAVSLFTGDNIQKELVRVADQGEPSLTIYSPSILVPSLQNENNKAYLQVVYVTNNPGAPAAFYQCSDVNIYR